MTGRDEQLQSLEKFYESEANNLTILYGRRGIGKTALLREFAINLYIMRLFLRIRWECLSRSQL